MSEKLVIYPAVDDSRLKALQSVGVNRLTIINAPDFATALREMSDATAFFGKLTPPLLTASTKLRWVQSPTASLEHYLFPELVEHPCVLTNMRGLFSDVIADHVFGYILMFARNLHRYLRQQMQATWKPVGGEATPTDFIVGPGVMTNVDTAHRHLADCTLGVVGVGHIGREILKRGSAFGMTLLGIDPVTRAVPGVLDEVWLLDRLPDLLAQSDFVVIAAPHTPETEKLFRSPQFEQMKRDAFLINIGRGVIVDLQSLTEALRAKTIAGAALDVFEIEPLPAEHPLWGMENAILTPHIAAASPRVSERHLETLLENLRRFLTGTELFTPVDKRKWY